ncbi:MAG: restriction endonuclease PLD domain-containing protein [Microcoleus sp.]
MIVFKRFVILQDPQNSLEKTIHFLLNCGEYSWDKIYLFSAFVTNDGVKQVKKILEHRSLNENTEVVIAIGQKDNFNKPSDIQKILSLSNSKNVDFICPETIDDDNFHIKAYCFLGSSVKGKGSKIGFSIIGSSNLTQTGLECKGELCISIQNLNLTNKLIEHLKNKYSNSPRWSPEIIREYQIEYDKKYPGKDQNEVLPILNRQDGKFIELGVLTDSALIAKATNLVNGREKINCFHLPAPTTLEEAKEDFREGSLCLLFSTENKRFQIVEIVSHSSDKEETEGCFVRFKVNVTYERSDDILEILANEKYKIISDAQDMEELPYKTLKDFEEEVKEYQEYQKMLNDPKYQKWIEKGKNKMQSEIERISKIDDIRLMKKELELLRQSI